MAGLFSCTVSSADVIHLKNGGMVRAEIIYEGKDYVKFEFRHGSGSISFSDIESIEREEPAVYHMRQGDYYLESRSFDDAIGEYSQALELDSALTEAKRGLEKAMRAKEEHKRAATKPGEKKGQAPKVDKYQQLVDLDLRKADLLSVLRHLSTIGGVNIIWDEGVLEGKRVTISVKRVPLLKAVEIILRNQELVYKAEPHGIWITTRERMLEADRITTLIYNARRGEVERLEKMVMKFLSEDGKVIVDKRRNILFITDRASSLKAISRVLEKID